MKERGKVLVVEDKERWVRRLRGPLEENNFYVDVVRTLDEAMELLSKRDPYPNYHFATVDLQLDEEILDDDQFEGWKVLEEMLKMGANRSMPIMVITGFPGNKLERFIDDKMTSNRLKAKQDYKVSFFMEKSNFDKKKFIEIVVDEVDRLDIRFHDDHRE